MRDAINDLCLMTTVVVTHVRMGIISRGPPVNAARKLDHLGMYPMPQPIHEMKSPVTLTEKRVVDQRRQIALAVYPMPQCLLPEHVNATRTM